MTDLLKLLGQYADVAPDEIDFSDLFTFNTLNVLFVPHDKVSPNSYNPNIIANTERILLLQSLIEDGWTQPIVTRLPDEEDYERLKRDDFDYVIVDGEQRWSTSNWPITSDHLKDAVSGILERQEKGVEISQSVLTRLRFVQQKQQEAENEGRDFVLLELTDGLVPVTVVDLYSDSHAMLSTLRHNKARGEFDNIRLANTLGRLTQLGLGTRDFSLRLGMSGEEAGELLMQAAARTRSLEELSKTDKWNIDLGPLADDPEILEYVAETTKLLEDVRVERRAQAAAEAFATEQVEADAREQTLTSEDRQRLFQEYKGEYEAENPVPRHQWWQHKLEYDQTTTFDFYLTPQEYVRCSAVFACFEGSLAERLIEATRVADALYAEEKV